MAARLLRRSRARALASAALAWAAVATSGLGSGGCSTFSERHFFKAVGPDGETVNYYRIRVDGCTGLSSSRYLSGYFDEAAVDAYFNEVYQPANAAIVPAAASTSTTGAGAAAAGGPAAIQPVGQEGKALVLILSSNADAIADQIGAFATNREMTATLGRLLNRDKIDASSKAADTLADAKAQGQTIAALGDSMVKVLSDANVDKDKANQAVLSFLNGFAREFGNTTPFADVASARKWLDENRGRLTARE